MTRPIPGFAAIVLALLLAVPVRAEAGGTAFHVLLDVSYAPDAGDSALKTNALVMDWYPRINDLLYDPGHPLPFMEIRVIFEPALSIKGAAAYVNGNELHVSSEYIKRMPDDFRAMVIHELTHINQHYPGRKADEGWIVEGIADYVRHKYYEKDIQAALRLDANGQMTGYGTADPYFYGLQRAGVSLTEKGYLRSYTVASTFMYWLETHKQPQIVHRLNSALAQGRYTPDLFLRECGESLDDLWKDFVTQSRVD